MKKERSEWTKKRETMARRRQLTRFEAWELQQKLLREWLAGAFVNIREAAVRHGVSDSVVQRLMARNRVLLEEETRETASMEWEKAVARMEMLIGEAHDSYERSKREETLCPACRGRGREKDGTECEVCDGEGTLTRSGPGDPKWLAVILKTQEELNKIRRFLPDKLDKITVSNKQAVILQQVENPLQGAPLEVVMQARQLLMEVKKGAGGEVVDVEFVENAETDDRE